MMAIRLGVIGCGYGRSVLVPAFRVDPRSEIVSISAPSKERVEHAASELGIQRALVDWHVLVEDKSVDAIIVATPPDVQPEIVLTALRQGKAVFAEKPMALNLAQAEDMTSCALSSHRPHMIDFHLTEITSWKQARQILMDGGIGFVQYVAVRWYVESYTNRMRLANWKSSASRGGGTLFNFVSHSLHYLEWFLGPITELSSRLFRVPNDSRNGDTSVDMALSFRSGAAGSLSVNAAAYLGTGHRIEFYGEDGALALENTTVDYVKGFRLLHGRRPDKELQVVQTRDPEEEVYSDGRVLTASRLARQFLDWVERDVPSRPDFRDGLRVQQLLDAALRSHHNRCQIDI